MTALLLTGCLPKSGFHVSIQVLDEETGAPIAGAWVLPAAHVVTVPPVDRFEVVAAERGKSGLDGVARFTKVLGLYRPDAPKTPLWKMVDAKQAAVRKPGHIAGGSIIVAAAGYGLIHQPFAVTDSPAYLDWLKKHAGARDVYPGLLGFKVVKANNQVILLNNRDLMDGAVLTVRLRKPSSATELGGSESFRQVRFMSATWYALSRQTGATEAEQKELYAFFARQMKAVADETDDPRFRDMYEAYFNEDAYKKYVSPEHAPGPQNQDGTIQLWLTQKALEILPPEAAEAKTYASDILAAVVDEGKNPAWHNHYLDPEDPGKGLPGSESALSWAGLDGDNQGNSWDWQDARRHYAAGDRRNAYIALGHVLRVLTNLSIPKYTVLDQSRATVFEAAITREMAANQGSLPPDFWHAVMGPAFALTPRARFEALAQGTAKAAAGKLEARVQLVAGSVVTDASDGDGSLETAKASLPLAIAQAAGLLWDFHRLTHPAAFVQAPGNGNGSDNGGPPAVQQSSGMAGGVTDPTAAGGPTAMAHGDSKASGGKTPVKRYDSYLATLAAAEKVDDLKAKLAVMKELDLHPITTPAELKATYEALDRLFQSDDSDPEGDLESAVNFLGTQFTRCVGPQFNALITELLKGAASWLPPGPLVEFHTGMVSSSARVRLGKMAALMRLAAQNRTPDALPILKRLEEKGGTLGGLAQKAVLEYGDPTDLERWLQIAGKRHIPSLTSFGRRGFERVVQELQANPDERRKVALRSALQQFSGEDVRDLQVELLKSKDMLILDKVQFGLSNTIRASRGNPRNRQAIEAMFAIRAARDTAVNLAAYDRGGPWAYDLVLEASQEGQERNTRQAAIHGLRFFGCRSTTIDALTRYMAGRDGGIRSQAERVLADLRKSPGCNGQ